MSHNKDNFQIQNNFRVRGSHHFFHFTPLNALQQSSFQPGEGVAYPCVKNSSPQCSISKLALLVYFKDSCNQFLCDSRDARFEL